MADELQSAVVSRPENEVGPKDFGCNFDECKEGEHAVVRVKFNDGYGIEMYKITSRNEDDESFMGINMLLDSKTVKQNEETCLRTKWWIPRKSSQSKTQQFSYNTIAYFPKLVESKIPSSVRRIIKKKNDEQRLKLFEQDEKLEEEYDNTRPGDKRKQISDSDSEYSGSCNDSEAE